MTAWHLTKDAGQAVTDDIKAAVEAVLADHGLKTHRLRWQYGDLYSFKIEAIPAGMDMGVDRWNRFAGQAGLPLDGLGRNITVNGTAYEVTGFETRRHKYPVMIKRLSDGEDFGLTLAQAQKVLA